MLQYISSEFPKAASHRGEGVQGAILWNPPDRMEVGRRQTIEVRLGDATVTVAALREGLRGRGTPYVDRLEVAPLMRVALVGEEEDFSIQEINSQNQYVRPGQIARWDFWGPLCGVALAVSGSWLQCGSGLRVKTRWFTSLVTSGK